MEANVSQIGQHESCRARTSCPHGRVWHLGMDPGGPAGERINKSKGPVETKKNDMAGIEAHNKASKTWPHQNQSEGGTIHEGTATHLLHVHHCPNPLSWALDVKKPIPFCLEVH